MSSLATLSLVCTLAMPAVAQDGSLEPANCPSETRGFALSVWGFRFVVRV